MNNEWGVLVVAAILVAFFALVAIPSHLERMECLKRGGTPADGTCIYQTKEAK